ncbi:MAG: hypothetical protein ACREMP_01450 [Candidatus Tyrphobacter sp.]
MLSLAVPVVQSAPALNPPSCASWPGAALPLRWDVGHAREGSDATTVHVATDGKFLYVCFDAAQSEPIQASQHSNDTVVGGSNIGGGIAWPDDAVWVDLWPTGPGGFQYQFESNPSGAHNESSSENVSFAPQWRSFGAMRDGGYTVTLAIPLAVIHGAHEGAWRVQFVRYVRSTGELDVWSYDVAQTTPDDPARAGTAAFPALARPRLPKPRVTAYALGEAASRTIGGSTSRVGADFSVPVTQTAAFFGTLHPDYSNVEIDQQSISPTVYQRIFSEVRPFFTQAASYYNEFNCSVCSGFHTTLYTPAIPTPAQGYAFEGRQGNFGLAGFDAIGDDRTDLASAMTYTSDDTHWQAALQHVGADLPGLVDDVNQGGFSWFNGKYLSGYSNYAVESGTLVTDPSQASWLDAGGAWIDQHFAVAAAYRRLGTQFDPVDGFDSHPGIQGYGIYAARAWTFSPNDFLSSAGIAAVVDRYVGTVTPGVAQADNAVILDFLTKGAIDVQLFPTGSNYWRFGPTLTPISQSVGFSVTYHSGMQNNLNNFPQHGASATPTQVTYYTGRYGPGRLDTWFRSSTLRVGERGYLTFTLDDTAQWMPHANAGVQWFDGVAYAYQVSANSSFAIGVRRIVGMPPVPNGGGNCTGTCSNISVAYHLRLDREEFYLAYGDPNTLVTVPQAIFKVIFYAGATKGT